MPEANSISFPSPRVNNMKMMAALVIGLYMMLAIGILIHLISQWRRERKPYKDQKYISSE